jgi:DNA end-binding protein Ku
VEVVPLTTVDLIQVEKTYYLGPDKGGDKAYKLLSASMERTGRIAVGRWAARGKEQLVLFRPYRGGLVLHQMFYADEVRDLDEVDTGAEFEFSDLEKDLAEKLIGELSVDAFEPDKYSDEYADRVRAAVDQKVAGQQITIAPEQPRAQIIDLFEALKKSLSEAQSNAKPTAEATGDDEDGEEAVDSDGVVLKPRPPKKAVPRKTRHKKSQTG